MLLCGEKTIELRRYPIPDAYLGMALGKTGAGLNRLSLWERGEVD
jgi:hypothetical protein